VEELLVLFVLVFFIVIIVGSILGITNYRQIGKLRWQVEQLSSRLDKYTDNDTPTNNLSENTSQNNTPVISSSPEPTKDQDTKDNDVEDLLAPSMSSAIADARIEAISGSSDSDEARSTASNGSTQKGFDLEKFLAGNGLLWLGGIILAIGGVFLAKYSIEAGLFPPGLRIILGSLFGIALVVVADYLLRHPQRFDINSMVVSASLASGGVITCYAMAFVAFDFYDFISPSIAFGLLAIISLSTAWLSIRLGPILAGIGIIGAYLVPALVSTGDSNVLLLLLYITVVSFSSVWVHQVVKQAWIWWLAKVGHFVWFMLAVLISLDEKGIDTAIHYPNLSIIMVFVVVSIYLFTLFPVLGWRLSLRMDAPLTTKALLMPRKEQLGVLLSLGVFLFYIISLPYHGDLLYALAAITAVLLLVPARHSAFDSWPYLGFALSIAVFLLMPQRYDYVDNLFVFTGGYLYLQTCVLVGLAYLMFMHLRYPARPAFLLLLAILPLLYYGIAYALSEPAASTYLYPLFAIELGVIGLMFSVLALKVSVSYHKMAYLMAANSTLALILTMLLNASTLTLAFAAQIALMAHLSRRLQLPLPAWLYKLAILAVMIRLTAAPWLSDYSNETIFSIQWTLVIYPLAFACLFFAYNQLASSDLKSWFAGALIHLIALFITTEMGQLLIGQYASLSDLDIRQSALLGMSYLIYACILLWRKQTVSHPMFYQVYAVMLFVGFAYMQGYGSVVFNPYFTLQQIGSNPFVNWLVPLWLIPAFTLITSITFGLINKTYMNTAYLVSGLLLLLYVNAIIRLIFNDNITLGTFPIEQDELYTYSVVYLALAISLIVFARKADSTKVLRMGFGLMFLVIIKAFLIDMNTLEGLYRALSFLGLGLSIVGVGWLFQRLKSQPVG